MPTALWGIDIGGSVGLGDLVLAATAAFAAWLAAHTANKRQDKQLTDARERLATQLDEENKRLTRQLAHDRAMRERDALRAVLDDAAQQLAIAAEGLGSFHAVLQQSPNIQPGSDPRENELRATVHGSVAALGNVAPRLALRLPIEHELTVTYLECRKRLLDWEREMVRYSDTRDGTLVPFDDYSRSYTDALNSFADACRRWAGT